VDGLWATKSEGVVQLDSKIPSLCDPDPPTSQTHRQTDGRTTCNLNYRAMYCRRPNPSKFR